ncbi:hypothetical protein GOV11_02710 [Candidatus Woesearchaeota archaeon]|nr:hypothetical protein [Candidatus Woesearchaeota archaeon]
MLPQVMPVDEEKIAHNPLMEAIVHVVKTIDRNMDINCAFVTGSYSTGFWGMRDKISDIDVVLETNGRLSWLQRYKEEFHDELVNMIKPHLQEGQEKLTFDWLVKSTEMLDNYKTSQIVAHEPVIPIMNYPRVETIDKITKTELVRRQLSAMKDEGIMDLKMLDPIDRYVRHYCGLHKKYDSLGLMLEHPEVRMRLERAYAPIMDDFVDRNILKKKDDTYTINKKHNFVYVKDIEPARPWRPSGFDISDTDSITVINNSG